MKKIVVLSAAFSFAALSGPAFATKIPITQQGVEDLCGAGKTSCYHHKCGTTTCSASCIKDDKGATVCTLTVERRKPKKPPVTQPTRHS